MSFEHQLQMCADILNSSSSAARSKKIKQGLEGLAPGWDEQPTSTRGKGRRGDGEGPIRGAFTDEDNVVTREDAQALAQSGSGRGGRNSVRVM